MSADRRTAETTARELAPVRAALLRRAASEADRLRAEAGAERDRLLTVARDRTDQIRAEAERRGRADAGAAADAALAAAGRTARRIVLEARRRAYEDLLREVSARIAAWLLEPAVEAAFRAQVVDLLGPDAVVSAVPGGLVGTSGGRRVELTAEALAREAVRELSAGVEELWNP